MSNLKLFENAEFGKLRIIDKDGEPWFVGKDVAEVLGYERATKAIQDHVDSEDKDAIPIRDSIGRNQNTPIINESGLYSLILSSKLPTAKKFKHWVTSEVLPAIHKHGGYLTDEKLEEVLSDPDTIIKLATQLKEERKLNKQLMMKTATQEQVIAELQPIKEYVDHILSSTDTVTTTQIAADYGISAVKLNSILENQRVQRSVGGQWILYRKHMNKGYTKSETIEVQRADGTTKLVMHTKWTQKGRLMIHEVLTKLGIVANMDKGVRNA